MKLFFKIACFILAFCCFNLLILAQVGEPDPNCEGAVQARLIVGESGRVLPGDSNNVRDIPSTDGTRIGTIPAEAEFTVLDGPRCVDGFNWWQVDFDGMIGWTVEGQGTEYWLEPVLSEETERLPDNPYRDPEHVIANALRIDVEARLQSPNESPISLYTLANTNSPIVTQLPVNTIVTLREEGAGGWWRIETEDGQDGWLQDGMILDYVSPYFFPVLVPVCAYSEDRVAFSFRDRVTGENLYTTQANGNQRCNLSYGITRRIEAYDWAPDGETLVFAGTIDKAIIVSNISYEDAVFVISTDGRTVDRISEDPYRIHDVAWSPGAVELPIAFLQSENEISFTSNLWLSNADASEQRLLMTNVNQPYLLHWSPDGSKLAFGEATASRTQTIHVMDIETGNDRIVYTSQWKATSLAWHPNSRLLLVSVYDEAIGRTVLKEIDIESLSTNIVLDNRAEGAIYNSDATLIAYWRLLNGVPRQIWILDTSTNESNQIASLPGINRGYIAWTEDDNAVLVNSEGVLQVEISTGRLQRLFSGTSGMGLPQPAN